MGTIPFKKLGAFFGAAIVVIASALWVVGGGIWKTDDTISENDLALQEEVERKRVIEADTDGDGLKDWEETLWGTDPKNSDTDGDQTLDGDEVDENRDPTIPGPDDELQDKKVAATTQTNTDSRSYFEDPNLNTTEAFSRDFFSQYVSLRDRNLPSNVQGSLYQGLINDAAGSFDVSEYSGSDLQIIYNNDDDVLAEYGTTVGEIIVDHKDYLRFDEPLILQNALLYKNQKDLQELVEMSLVYESLVKDLLEVPVPVSKTDFHLNLVNNYAGLAASVYKMSEAFIDPVGTMFAFQAAQRYVENLNSFFEEILSTSDYL